MYRMLKALNSKAKKFIIVDDDLAFCKTISYIIQENRLGDIAAICMDGLKAENIIRTVLPDVIVVDLLLPGQSGIELIKKVKMVDWRMSFIMMSACTDKTMVENAYLSGADAFLSKPINVFDFVDLVKALGTK